MRLNIMASVLVLALAAPSHAVLKVVTTTEDLASLVSEVGGDKVKVDSIARGYQDPHFVEPKPSFVLKLMAADLVVAIGRELESGWLPPLLQQCRNARVQPGTAGYLDASTTVKILDIPTGEVTRALGDVHSQGNPHYWLDPDNGRKMADAIRAKLSELDAANAPTYAARYADFDKRLAEAERRWDAAMAPYKGTKIVTYHRSWPNFCERFGLDVIAYVEPKPGIPPSPRHTLELIARMKTESVKIILVEPYFDAKTPNAIGRDTGAEVLVMMPSVGGEKELTDYIKLFDYDIKLLTDALKATGGK